MTFASVESTSLIRSSAPGGNVLALRLDARADPFMLSSHPGGLSTFAAEAAVLAPKKNRSSPRKRWSVPNIPDNQPQCTPVQDGSWSLMGTDAVYPAVELLWAAHDRQGVGSH
jgi:hypothetical protein